MRTLELLNVFSKKELDEVGEIIAGKKKKSLQLLYRELLKLKNKNEEPVNEKLFGQTFGSKYSKQKDYLLRNELRLLNEIIYDYLLTATFKEYTYKNQSIYNHWLLKSFFDRKLKSFFEANINAAVNQSRTDIKPADTSEMLSLKILWLIQNQPRTVENLQQQLELAKQWKLEEERRFLYRIREAEAREAFVQMMLDHVQNTGNKKKADGRTPGQTVFNLQPVEAYDWFARYLLLKKHSSQTKNEVKIAVLKQMLEIEEANPFITDIRFNAQIVTLGNIGLEYVMLENFEEADKYMAEGIKRCEANKHDIPIGNIQNYIANQVNLKRFEKGVVLFKRFEKKILKSRSAAHISILACFCHLFLKQPDEAISLIPSTAKMTPDNVVVSRLIYAIAFFIRGDFSLAYNECVNLKRSAGITSVGQQNDIYILIVQWLTRYFAAFMKDKSAKQKELSALRKTLEEQQAVIAPHLKKEFALLWLVNAIK